MTYDYDAVFMSDLHIGTNRCNTRALISFLKNLRTRKLVLVGDIIDIYCLEKYKTNWTREHTKCISLLIQLARSGTEVVYVTGNHEASLRNFSFRSINFTITSSYTHRDRKCNSFLCVHGDRYSKYSSGIWRQLIFNKGYELISPLNTFLKKFNFSLIPFLRRAARNYIEQYQQDLIEITPKNYKGVIVGHIHVPKIQNYDDLTYMCCGDFCDSNSAIAEINGNYELLYHK